MSSRCTIGSISRSSAIRLGRWTTLTHNAARQLVAVRDSLGRTTSFDRCAAARSTASSTPTATARIGTATSKAGLPPRRGRTDRPRTIRTRQDRSPETVTDRKGEVTTYSYLADGDLQQKAYTNAQVATATVSLTYDSAV